MATDRGVSYAVRELFVSDRGALSTNFCFKFVGIVNLYRVCVFPHISFYMNIYTLAYIQYLRSGGEYKLDGRRWRARSPGCHGQSVALLSYYCIRKIPDFIDCFHERKARVCVDIYYFEIAEALIRRA